MSVLIDSIFITSGASGTSTPNKDGAKESVMCKRSDNYNNAAMAEIKKSLQTFKKDDTKDDLEVSKASY